MLPASAKLASCGHLRLCKLPWMQVQLPWVDLPSPSGSSNPVAFGNKFCRRQNFLACGLSHRSASLLTLSTSWPPLPLRRGGLASRRARSFCANFTFFAVGTKRRGAKTDFCTSARVHSITRVRERQARNGGAGRPAVRPLPRKLYPPAANFCRHDTAFPCPRAANVV